MTYNKLRELHTHQPALTFFHAARTNFAHPLSIAIPYHFGSGPSGTSLGSSVAAQVGVPFFFSLFFLGIETTQRCPKFGRKSYYM